MPPHFFFHSLAHYALNESGHPFSYHLSCQRAVESCGGTFHAYLPLDTSLKEVREGWVKWFDPSFRKRGKWKFFIECGKIFRRSSPPSIFFLESFGRREFRSFALAALLFAKKRDKVCLLFRDDLIYRHRRDRFAISFFSKLLQWKLKKRLILLSDSALIADFFTPLLRQKMEVLPIPHTDFEKRSPNQKGEKIALFWPGSPRKEKGLAVIYRLMKMQDPLSKKFSLTLSEEVKNLKSENGLLLHFLPGALSIKEYQKQFLSCDIILIPYDPSRYQRRTSGIFVEAICAQKIPVVSPGTWMANELLRYRLSELILDPEHPQLFSQLSLLHSDEKVQEKLKVMQQEYGSWHTFESFTKTMNQLLFKQ